MADIPEQMGWPDIPAQPGQAPLPMEYEPVTGDALTRWIKSITNWLQGQGASAFQTGQGMLPQAQAGFGTAQDTLATSTDYWSKILSGDEKAMAEAVAPEAQRIQAGYQGATRQAQANLPRGGYASTMLAQLPFMQARDVSNLFSTLRPQAATQLASNAATGGNLASLLGQLGLGESGLGAGMLQSALQGNLERRGQNVQDTASARSLGGQLGGKAIDLVSNLIGAKMGGCWIAEAIYGDDLRTAFARLWLNGPFQQTVLGKVVMAFYLRFGERIAPFVKRHPRVQRFLRPLFDRAVKAGALFVFRQASEL